MEVDSSMQVDNQQSSSKCSHKRFEIKKWMAVAMWAWDIEVDNCAICRNHIMDLCIECQANWTEIEKKKLLFEVNWKLG